MGVIIFAGARLQIRMPYFAFAMRKDSVRLFTAALVAAYVAIWGLELRSATELIFIIVPIFLSHIPERTASIPLMTPCKFILTVLRWSAWSNSVNSPPFANPALFIKQSTVPNLASHC